MKEAGSDVSGCEHSEAGVASLSASFKHLYHSRCLLIKREGFEP